jgi:hypothetical protein
MNSYRSMDQNTYNASPKQKSFKGYLEEGSFLLLLLFSRFTELSEN